MQATFHARNGRNACQRLLRLYCDWLRKLAGDFFGHLLSRYFSAPRFQSSLAISDETPPEKLVRRICARFQASFAHQNRLGTRLITRHEAKPKRSGNYDLSASNFGIWLSGLESVFSESHQMYRVDTEANHSSHLHIREIISGKTKGPETAFA